MWRQTYALVRQDGCNLLLVAGGRVDPSNPEGWAHTAIYRMLSPRLISGALVLHVVTEKMQEPELERFARALPAVPTVTTTVKVGSLPCFAVDNTLGLRDLMRHLIEVHGCRRIVHVRGPHPQREAQTREDVWRDELLRAGIVPQDPWLVQGDFEVEKVPRLFEDLWVQTRGEFDAVVACNDLAAIAVIEGLQRLGYHVPGDYLVCGFDDIVRSQYVSPSLTTVHQPAELQVRQAWEGLRTMMDTGLSVPDGFSASSLVVRTSCSCGPERWSPEAFSVLRDRLGNALEIRDLPAVVAEFDAEASRFRSEVYLLHDFVRTLNRVADWGHLAPILEDWLPRLGIGVFAFLNTCTESGEPAEFIASREPDELLATAPAYFHVLTSRPGGSGQGRILASDRLSLESWFPVPQPFTLGAFPLVVGDTWYGLAILELGPEAGLFVLAVQEQVASVLERLSREKALEARTLEERTRTLVQTERRAALSRMVAALAHQINTPLGAILSSQSTLEAELRLEALQVTEPLPITADAAAVFRTLWSGFLESGPDESFTARRTRRKLLTGWLQELGVDEPDRYAEELAVIGFRGALHELKMLTALPGWQPLLSRLCGLADQFTATEIIAQASRKIADFLQTLRSSADGPGEQPPVALNLRESLETVVRFLRDDWGPELGVEWDVPALPAVLGRPDEIAQVWINLLRNACQAMDGQGQIELSAAEEAASVVVRVTDHGPGIREADQPRIFTPFFSTRAHGEGLGLGLESVKRMVESVGGKVGFESSPGRTTFWVRLPAASTGSS